MIWLAFLSILGACSPFSLKVMEDVVVGEIKVAEIVYDDLNPTKPQINIIK